MDFQTISINPCTAPRLSMLLIAYNQADTIRQAIVAALAKTYSPLEILISDDTSSEQTFAVMPQSVAGYRGPHKIKLLRNKKNLGIGAHLSHVAALAEGELLLVAAGDDVSLPERCTRMAQIWENSNRQLDLIASSLADMDSDGRLHQRITSSDLSSYRTAGDWMAGPPHVIGAGQAKCWSVTGTVVSRARFANCQRKMSFSPCARIVRVRWLSIASRTRNIRKKFPQ